MSHHCVFLSFQFGLRCVGYMNIRPLLLWVLLALFEIEVEKRKTQKQIGGWN